MSKKRTSFVFVVALIAIAFAVPAYATYGDSGYVTWGGVKDLPGQAPSPHSGFTTTTVKCAVCHSVHNADAMGNVLLATDVASACNYCHLDTTTGISQVYESDTNNYQGTDLPNAHNDFEILGVEKGVTCNQCHQVHAADFVMTDNEYLTQKLLRGSKTQDGTYDPLGGAPVSGEESNTALTKWCARCHFTGLGTTYTYYMTDYNNTSHVMTAAADAYDNTQVSYGGRVAWKDSTNCSSCHSSGYTTSKWPHFTPGNRFLESATNASDTPVGTTNDNEDGVCLRCHRAGDGVTGIGQTF